LHHLKSKSKGSRACYLRYVPKNPYIIRPFFCMSNNNLQYLCSLDIKDL
jgi:hypothetical protein